MQIIGFLIVWGVIMKMLADYEPMHKRIKRMDNDPNCSLKSDKWKREHGQL